jgi:FtsH-binding integral membrane protein
LASACRRPWSFPARLGGWTIGPVGDVGSVVFTGLTAWDTQRLKTMYPENRMTAETGNMAILGALMLYLDFVNLFISLLLLVGVRRD